MISARANVDTALETIAAHNAELGAFRQVAADQARAMASAQDRLVSAGAWATGPLQGLPLGVKDIIDVAGLPTQAGSLTRASHPPAHRDALVVAKLKAAGAIVVGKTNTVEYAFGGWGTNITVGTPKNPWDRTVHRTPGGSSSGSGVAVGAGLVAIALGTDTGGSVRIPASVCGCVGLKTSIGLVGRSGVVPLAMTFDTVGPIARTVRLAAQMLQVMQGPDPDDPATAVAPVIDALVDLDRGIRGFRLGRVADDDLPLMAPDVREAYHRAILSLAAAGATVVPFHLPQPLEACVRHVGIIIAAEAYAAYRAFVDDPSSPLHDNIRSRMAAARGMTATDLIEAQRARQRAIVAFEAVMDRVDAIILPTTPIAAIPLADVDEAKTPFASHTRFVNYHDLAAISVPMSVTPSGLPLGLQIVVRRFQDPLALRIAQAFEAVRGPFPGPL